MDGRYISIIGGNFRSALLALKMREACPELAVKVFVDSKTQEEQTWSFRQSDLHPEYWSSLSQFAYRIWNSYGVELEGHPQSFLTGVGIIRLSDLLFPLDVENLEERPLDEVLHRSIFVIDTRNNFYVPTMAFHKTVEIALELEDDHGLEQPSLMIGKRSPSSSELDYFQYFPLGKNELLLKEIRMTKDPRLIGENFDESLRSFLRSRDWRIKRVKYKTSFVQRIPEVTPAAKHMGRIIKLNGFVNEVSGESLHDVLRVNNLLVRTSFRYGEVKEALRDYHEKRETSHKILRVMNRWMLNEKRIKNINQNFGRLYQMPGALRDLVLSGELVLGDLWRISASFFLRADQKFRLPKISRPHPPYEHHQSSQIPVSLQQ